MHIDMFAHKSPKGQLNCTYIVHVLYNVELNDVDIYFNYF